VRIVGVQLFSYSLPFVRPIAILGDVVTIREGYVLSVTDEFGETGWGEFAALPGQSAASATVSLLEFRTAAARLRGVRVHDDEPLDYLLGLTIPFDVPSSAVMGLESAVLTLLARRRNLRLASLISLRHSDYVAINSLIESTDRLESRVAEIIAEGTHTVKLKVGRQSVADDIELVNRVRRVLPPPVRLRLDANRRWSMDEAVEFARGIAETEIEYIEEPLTDFNQLEKLSRTAPHLPLAIDESVRSWSVEQIRTVGYLKAVVLKPSVIGGIRRTVELARVCRESGKTPVISSAIESSIGLSVLAHLSAALTPGMPSGLDTARLFGRDLISPPFPSGRSRVSLDELYPLRGVIDRSLLTEAPLE
jgi:o-succinylbenzoate synthase